MFLPIRDLCLSIQSKITMLLMFQENFQDVQHHGKLAKQDNSVTLTDKKIQLI